jgi:hypothetical protein
LGNPVVKKSITLGEMIKRLGFARDTQVELYGEMFELISDPIFIKSSVFVDAIESKSGRLRRVRIPDPVVVTARRWSVQRTGALAVLPVLTDAKGQ